MNGSASFLPEGLPQVLPLPQLSCVVPPPPPHGLAVGDRRASSQAFFYIEHFNFYMVMIMTPRILSYSYQRVP